MGGEEWAAGLAISRFLAGRERHAARANASALTRARIDSYTFGLAKRLARAWLERSVASRFRDSVAWSRFGAASLAIGAIVTFGLCIISRWALCH